MFRFVFAAAAALMLSLPATSHAFQIFVTKETIPLGLGPNQEIVANTGGPTTVASGSGNYQLWYDLAGVHINNLQLNFTVLNGASITGVVPPADATGGSSTNAAAIWNNLGGGLNFIATLAAEFNCSNFGAPAAPAGNCPVSYVPVPMDGSNASLDGTQIFLAGAFTLDLSGHTGGDILRIDGSSLYNLASGGAGIPITNQTISGTNIILGAGGSAPEPVSLALLGMGLAGLAFVRRRA